MFEVVRGLVKTAHATVAVADPYIVHFIHGHTRNHVAVQRIRIGVVFPVGAETDSVETVQPVIGGDPQQSVFVLREFNDDVVRYPLINGVPGSARICQLGLDVS